MQCDRATIAIAVATALCASAASANDTLYATSATVPQYLRTMDPSTGNVTWSVPITGSEVLSGMTSDGHDLYSIDGASLNGSSDRTFRIDPMTGAGAVVGNTGFDWNFRSIEIDPQTGDMYSVTDNELYTVNKLTGVAQSIAVIFSGGSGHLNQVTAFAINANGEAYVTDTAGQSLFRLDLSNVQLTWIGDLGVDPNWWFRDLAFDSSGQLWGAWKTGGMYKIDTTNATCTLAFNSAPSVGIAFKPECSVTSYCTAKSNSLGCMPAIGSSGAPSASFGSGFVVSCSNVRNHKNGLLFYGVNGQSSLPFQGGTLCVKSQVHRTPAVNSGGAAPPANDCSGVFAIDMNSFAAGGLGGNPLAALSVPGTIVDCQWWGRDPGFPAPFNTTLSDALEYQVCP